MLIYFDNWHISVKLNGVFMQNDNLADTLTVEGELPDEFSSWSLLLRANDESNVVSLGTVDGKPGIILTDDMFPYGDTFYGIQLRGESGEKVRHSDVEYVYLSGSIGGSGSWSALPGEFTEAEARLRDISSHPPIPDESGEFWAIWDTELGEYVTSEYPLPVVDVQSAIDDAIGAVSDLIGSGVIE